MMDVEKQLHLEGTINKPGPARDFWDTVVKETLGFGTSARALRNVLNAFRKIAGGTAPREFSAQAKDVSARGSFWRDKGLPDFSPLIAWADGRAPGDVRAVAQNLLDAAAERLLGQRASSGQSEAAAAVGYVDQFSISAELAGQPVKRTVQAEAFLRNPEVRKQALRRAAGKCEWCRQPGFPMANGAIFLETHHVVPLAEGGGDNERNVVALCANHHREAHYGAKSSHMRNELLTRSSR